MAKRIELSSSYTAWRSEDWRIWAGRELMFSSVKREKREAHGTVRTGAGIMPGRPEALGSPLFYTAAADPPGLL
jgi:hypothetical protein